MTTRILALCGSLRSGSLNRMALAHAQKLAGTHGARIDVGDISAIPVYNQDDQEQAFPASVSTLGQQIAEADAILFVSPEYNYSVPGVLKNTIDWLSRLPEQPFRGKPVAVMGCSMGAQGTSRMQYHLRQIMVFLDAHVLNKPEVMIGAAHNKFDEQGQLTDAKAAEMIERLLDALVAWSAQLGR